MSHIPTNRYGQLISFATEVDEDTRFHRWMWITIPRGVTVQQVAAQRGHPDDARRIADENSIRSVRSKLYRPKLKVPGELRASASFDVLAGDQPPRIVGGYAKLETLDRPERVGLTVFEGFDPIRMEVPVRFQAGQGGDGSRVERDISLLERMAGRGVFSGSGIGSPPIIRLSTTDASGGIVPLIPEAYQWSRQNPSAPLWRVADIDWDAEPRRHRSGKRISQKATVVVQQATKITLQQRSAAVRSKAEEGPALEVSIDELTGTLEGDRDVWARQIINSRTARRKAAPKRVDLETAILGIDIDDTIRGSSVVTLQVADPGWELLDSEFFDVDDDGRLDPIDVNYPEGSEYWWRLTMLSINMRGGLTLGLHFMERAAAHMMAHRGPVKAARGKTTRAEFIKSLSDRVKAGGGINFRCKELRATQRVAGGTLDEEKPDRKRKRDKAPGIHRDESITFTNWDGGRYTLKPGELGNAEEVLDECFALTQDSRSIMACLTACIVEAPFFRNPSGGHSSSVGILQLLNIHLGGSVAARRDIRRVVRLFMRDGFTGRGGAIELARKHPEWSVGKIAQEVQGSAHPDRYDKVKDGARQVLDAYGGEGGVTTSRRRTYHFTIGSPEDPREDYWEGSQRLADEVEWPLFLDGQDLYYDPETVLIRQRPAAIIRRSSPSVVSFDCDWDTRQIATEATLELICDPLEFRAGEVFKLVGFGPASIGSTVKLPGRWLIEEVKRNRFSLASTFTLKQPSAPKPEPAPEVATSTRSGGTGGGGSGTAGTASGSWIKPTDGPMTSPYGQRWGRLHDGIDYGIPVGSPIKAVDGGTVTAAGPNGGYGEYVAIRHGSSLLSFYAHLSRINVRVGEKVRQGQVIARSGNTGSSTGPHLHFGAKRNGASVNPATLLP